MWRVSPGGRHDLPEPHRRDEFPAEYSLAGCSPAEPASACSAGFMLHRAPSFVEQNSANGNLGLWPVSHARGSLDSAYGSVLGYPVAVPLCGTRSCAVRGLMRPRNLKSTAHGDVPSLKWLGLSPQLFPRTHIVGYRCAACALTVCSILRPPIFGNRRLPPCSGVRFLDRSNSPPHRRLRAREPVSRTASPLFGRR